MSSCIHRYKQYFLKFYTTFYSLTWLYSRSGLSGTRSSGSSVFWNIVRKQKLVWTEIEAPLKWKVQICETFSVLLTRSTKEISTLFLNFWYLSCMIESRSCVHEWCSDTGTCPSVAMSLAGKYQSVYILAFKVR